MADKDNIHDEMEEAFQLSAGNCQACGGILKAEKVNLEEIENGKLYLMENVSAYVCEQCGEKWIPEPIIKEFEKMIETTHKFHKKTSKKKSSKNKKR
ncbi:hypothetical protein A2290_05685 [candidate division WOR-1 bacterium RIFOXYB2_FULL_36_35]|uniref:YgiT-type zinc finger domain-containing protein n=1 Tax=candidate division WOR-1 bacterium RIFOXYB2_FULL_36_35 TaxID=1802578 RepID=A0A1F4S5X4_UNCSA|nr:MAG: hypothetical protein A2290_05685 [candidate division WOR-1 bacterium RIFOXYB2_FULL_36_35]